MQVKVTDAFVKNDHHFDDLFLCPKLQEGFGNTM